MNDLRFRDFRADQPLGDDSFASIRRAVLNETRTPQLRFVRIWLRPAIAAVLLISFLSFALFLMHPRVGVPTAEQPKTPAAAAGPTTAPTVTSAPGPSARSTVPDLAPAPAVPPAQVQSVARVARHHKRPAPESRVATAAHEPVVIQLQTSDPDIRIIWIAR